MIRPCGALRAAEHFGKSSSGGTMENARRDCDTSTGGHHVRAKETVMTYPDSTAIYPPWDGETPIEIYKWARDLHMQRVNANRSSLLLLRDAQGRQLYRVTCSGNIARNYKVSPATRKRVLARDAHSCVWCGATRDLELDHIVRYADGGSNDADNLRTLCHSCHTKRQRGRKQ